MRHEGGRDHHDPRDERQDNGLTAAAFVPLTDVEPAVGAQLLHALARARIAAYLAVPTDTPPTDRSAAAGATGGPTDGSRRRLYVASDDRIDARTIVAAAIRGLGADQPPLPEPDDDPFDPERTQAEFDALVADWHVDTIAAVREAERDLAREDADWRARLAKPPASDEVWLDEDHYVPPPPPPLPRLTRPTILAMTILAVSIVLLGVGGQAGLAGSFVLILGACGIVLGIGILFTRLRDHGRDEDDDGSAI